MNSIPSPQTVLTMYNKLTMVMLPAGVKNSQDYDSHDFLSWFQVILVFSTFVLTKKYFDSFHTRSMMPSVLFYPNL